MAESSPTPLSIRFKDFQETEQHPMPFALLTKFIEQKEIGTLSTNAGCSPAITKTNPLSLSLVLMVLNRHWGIIEEFLKSTTMKLHSSEDTGDNRLRFQSTDDRLKDCITQLYTEVSKNYYGHIEKLSSQNLKLLENVFQSKKMMILEVIWISGDTLGWVCHRDKITGTEPTCLQALVRTIQKQVFGTGDSRNGTHSDPRTTKYEVRLGAASGELASVHTSSSRTAPLLSGLPSGRSSQHKLSGCSENAAFSHKKTALSNPIHNGEITGRTEEDMETEPDVEIVATISSTVDDISEKDSREMTLISGTRKGTIFLDWNPFSSDKKTNDYSKRNYAEVISLKEIMQDPFIDCILMPEVHAVSALFQCAVKFIQKENHIELFGPQQNVKEAKKHIINIVRMTSNNYHEKSFQLRKEFAGDFVADIIVEAARRAHRAGFTLTVAGTTVTLAGSNPERQAAIEDDVKNLLGVGHPDVTGAHVDEVNPVPLPSRTRILAAKKGNEFDCLGPMSLPNDISMSSVSIYNHPQNTTRFQNGKNFPSDDWLTLKHASGVVIKVGAADITQLKVDVIVNAANERLSHDGGVAFAISKAAGWKLDQDCEQYIRTNRQLKVTDNCITAAGNLPCKKVIHAVGPRWYDYHGQGGKDKCKELLCETFLRCMRAADNYDCQSMAIPAISAAIFAVPQPVVAEQAVKATVTYCRNNPKLKLLLFVDINSEMVNHFKNEFGRLGKEKDFSKETSFEASHAFPEKNPAILRDLLQKELRIETSRQSSSSHMNIQDRGKPSYATVTASNTSSSAKYSAPDDLADDVVKSVGAGAAESCAICMDKLKNPKQLPCSHKFCAECIEEHFKNKKTCPICGKVHGKLTGSQPDGTMSWWFSRTSLPGYEKYGTITIGYDFPSGRQGEGHPQPGQRYAFSSRMAYLPSNDEGRQVLWLLKKAFDQRLVFTIGQSVTTGKDGVITWNDVHHKTNMDGGPENFGYPDPSYLSRVTSELADKGITWPSRGKTRDDCTLCPAPLNAMPKTFACHHAACDICCSEKGLYDMFRRCPNCEGKSGPADKHLVPQGTIRHSTIPLDGFTKVYEVNISFSEFIKRCPGTVDTTQLTGYLPDTCDGREVLRMIRTLPQEKLFAMKGKSIVWQIPMCELIKGKSGGKNTDKYNVKELLSILKQWRTY